jgi:tRNA uridine 5-carbamoylmethylation protein Kti12
LVNKNFIICLTGLPASGKTTFANSLKLILEKSLANFTTKIIDPDVIRQKIAPNKFNYKLEPTVRKQNLTEVGKELTKGNVVISDDLNYYSSMRHDLKNLADDFNVKFFIIYISTPFETCLEWNKKRVKPIPSKIIERIHKKFDDFGKYNWDYPEAKFDISQIKDLNKEIEDLVNILIKKISISKKILEEKRELRYSLNWDNQNLDKITRIYVGKLLGNPKLTPLKKKIIKTRKLFVKHYKNKALKELEIATSFNDCLEKSLNIKISDDFT